MRTAVAAPLASVKGWPLAILGLGILLAVIVHLQAVVSPFDDAFITFKYVDNFHQGRGAVYNPGEHVLGVSCPLYAVWLVALKALWSSVETPALAAHWNILPLAGAGLICAVFLRRVGLGRIAASITASLLVIGSDVLRTSISGMETSLYLLLIFGALLASATDRDTVAILLSSTAALVRPEAVLLSALVLIAAFLDRASSRRGLRPLLGLAPLGLWLVCAGAYYGSPVPQSVVAKALPCFPLPPGTAMSTMSIRVGDWCLHGFLLLWSWIGTLLGARSRSTLHVSTFAYYSVAFLLTAWGVWIWWFRWGRSRPLKQLVLPAYLVSLIVFYGITNPYLLQWYFTILQGPWIVVVYAAALGVRFQTRIADAIRTCLATGLLLTAGAGFIGSTYVQGGSNLIEYGAAGAAESAKLNAYARASNWLSGNTAANQTVCSNEIGILGYRLDRRILDAYALVTPAAAAYLPVPMAERGPVPGVIPSAFIRDMRPDYVVAIPLYARTSIMRSHWFVESYQVVHQEPIISGGPGKSAVLIFKRRL